VSYDIVLALPTEDRRRAHAFVRALGFETPGEHAEDGVPEPLRVVLNERASVIYIPTDGFGWVTDGRRTADRATAECLLTLQVGTAAQVDDTLARAATSGGVVASAAQHQPWGYSGTFADPDGHLWQVLAQLADGWL
jgi:predicted lactoylglutathione lyase